MSLTIKKTLVIGVGCSASGQEQRRAMFSLGGDQPARRGSLFTAARVRAHPLIAPLLIIAYPVYIGSG